jgi:RNA polymerase sigma factor (sigma-70 family)
MTSMTTVPEGDLVLLRRFAQGRDEQAFAEIVRRYAGLVFSTCQRVLGDRSLAEDASQETFYRLMRKPDAVTRSLPGWLHRAATELAIDAARSESARRRREAAYADAPKRDPSTWHEMAPHVDAALAELPEPMQRLLVEHFLMGRPQQALAAELGVSPATLSRRMHDALDRLRERLGAQGVALGVGLIPVLLAEHAAAALCPPRASLLASLGKMAMVSGMAPAAGAASVWVEIAEALPWLTAARAKAWTLALVAVLTLAALALAYVRYVAPMTDGPDTDGVSRPRRAWVAPGEPSPPLAWILAPRPAERR